MRELRRRAVLGAAAIAVVVLCGFLSRAVATADEAPEARSQQLTIPESHPRLWWTPERLQRARAWYAKNHFTPRGDDYVGHAFRYLMTGDAKTARIAIDYALGLIVQDMAANNPDPDRGIASNGARWHGETIALIYDWCYPQITSAERKVLIDRWNTYIDNLTKRRWGGPSMPQSNYYWGYLRNEFEWAVATWGENPAAPRFLDHALETRWRNSFLPHAKSGGAGGVLQEGSGYGRAMTDYVTVPGFTSAFLGRPLLLETNFFKEAVYYLIYSTPPGRTLSRATKRQHWEMFPFADDERFVNGGDLEAIAWLNYMTAAADAWRDEPVGQYARRWKNMIEFPASSYIQAADRGGSELRFTSLPHDYYASGPGFLYARNGWTASATAVHLQLGQTYDEGHAHDDYGNWQMWRKGRWISRETTGYTDKLAGYGGSGIVETNHILAHNTLLVDRKGFARAFRNGRPVVTRVESRPAYAYAAVDLTPSYRNNKVQFPRPELDNPAVSHVEREFVFVRPLNALLIFDRLEAAKDVVKTFIAHFEETPAMDGTKGVVVNAGDQAIRLTTLLPAAPAYRIVAEGGRVGQHRVEVEAGGHALTYFLHVVHARDQGDRDLELSVSDTAKGYAVTLRHPALGECSANFAKGASAGAGGVSCSSGGSGEFSGGIQKMEVGPAGPRWQSLN
jgi:hypothetical protein